MIGHRLSPSWFFATGAAILAILIQIQITIGRTDDSLGLTLNLADFTLPLAGGLILISLIKRKTIWPRWRLSVIDIGMAALTGYFLFSAFYAYTLTGHLSPWALINRLVGWGVLMGYFYAGAWLATNKSSTFILPFLMTFTIFCLITHIASTGGIILNDLGILSADMPHYPLAAQMGNRNAAAFIFLSALSVLTLLTSTRAASTFPFLLPVFLFLVPSVYFLNGSRAIIVLLPLVLIWALFQLRRFSVRKTLIPVLAGLLFFIGVLHLTGKDFFREDQTERLSLETIAAASAHKIHPSDSTRAIVNKDAFDLFLSHPFFGVGLGNFMEIQKTKYGHLIDLIDSIPLWFLTEMGLVGLTLFLLFGAILFLSILKGAQCKAAAPGSDSAGAPAFPCSHETLMCRCTLAIILLFIAMGLVHQIFYARFFWLFLGLAAATPASKKIP